MLQKMSLVFTSLGSVILTYVLLFGPLPKLDVCRTSFLGFSLFSLGCLGSMFSSWREKQLTEKAFLLWFRAETLRCIAHNEDDRLRVLVSAVVSAVDVYLLSFEAFDASVTELSNERHQLNLSQLICDEVRQRLESCAWAPETADDVRQKLIKRYSPVELS